MKSDPAIENRKLNIENQPDLDWLFRGERRLGHLLRLLFLLLATIVIGQAQAGRFSDAALVGLLLYGSLALALVVALRWPGLLIRLGPAIPPVSCLADTALTTLLIYLTGGIGSEWYLLYGLIAVKAAIYFTAVPVTLLVSFLGGPAYFAVLALHSRGFLFLLDNAFLWRYLLLWALIGASSLLAWTLRERETQMTLLEQRLEENSRDLAVQARTLQGTAQDLANRVLELRTLQEGIKAINTSSLSLEDLLTHIVANASQVLRGVPCSLGLLDESGEVVIRASSDTVRPARPRARFRPGEGVAGWVIQTGRAVRIADVTTDSRFIPLSDQPILSLISVPMVSDGRPIGALTATSAQRAAFSEDDVALLSAFADQAAIAVRNARFYERLAQDKSQIEAILRGIGDAVIVTDDHLNLILLNPVAAEIFAVQEPVGVGLPLPLVVSDEKLIALINQALGGDTTPAMGEIVRPARNGGKELTYQALASPFMTEDNQPEGVVTVLRDITGQKELEKMKSAFLSMVSHELKTPLHSIKGFVDIILMGKTGRINELQRDFLGSVQVQTLTLQRLIEELLEISRLEAGQVRLRPETIRLAEIAEGVVNRLRPLADESRVELAVQIPAGLPPIEADRLRVEQVISNLVDNAIKFTPAGGQVRVLAEDQGEMVRVSVCDTGIGIPPDQRDRVFERFYQVDGSATRSYKGIGLGLTICKEIVARHGGRIWVESETGKGSQFHFTLPKQLPQGELALDFAG